MADKEFQRLSGMFDQRMRISIADRYSANLKAEIGLQQDGFLDWAQEAFQPCGIHRLHSSIKNATNVFSFDISGLLNLGLACQEVGSTRTMRGILAMIFNNELVIDHSPPPGGQAVQHRKAVFDLYLPLHGPSIHRSLAKMNHEWGPLAGLETPLRERLLRRRVTNQSTCCSLCHVGSYPTQTTDPLQENPELMAEFMGVPAAAVVAADAAAADVHKAHARGHRQVASQQGWVDSVLEDASSVSATAQPQVQPLPPSPELAAANEDEAPADADAGAVAGTAAADGVDWAELKRQQKKGAKAWLETHPAPRLAVLTSTIAGFQGLLSCFLRISSVKWRKEQEHNVLQTGQRSYPVLEMSHGKHVQRVLEDSFAAIPLPMPGLPDGLTSAVLKELRFRAFSAGLSAIHIVLRVPHNNTPYQFFELYTSGQFQRLLNWPKCCLDGLSSAMLEKYGRKKPWNLQNARQLSRCSCSC